MSMSVVRILFVGQWDVREELAATFGTQPNRWSVDFAATGTDALEKLQAQTYDAVVTEIELAGVTAVDLLGQVKERSPLALRFVLSASSNHQALICALGAAHQIVGKPCKPAVLEKLIVNSLAMRMLLNDDRLHARIAQIDKLPVLPSIYNQLVKEMKSESVSVRRVADLIRGDIAITARVLQIINSAHFGMSRRVESVLQAVNLLGLDIIKTLVLTSGVFSQFEESGLPGFLLDEIYSHSLAVGTGAQHLANAMGLSNRQAEEALTAGALHDIGKLVLVTNFETEARQIVKSVQQQQLPLHEAERQVLGVSHCEIGAHLLSLWGLSDQILEAVAFHENPQSAAQPTLGVLTAVHLANAFDHDQRASLDDRRSTTADVDYLGQVGLSSQTAQLRALMASDRKKEQKAAQT